jgi:hypothetical protein
MRPEELLPMKRTLSIGQQRLALREQPCGLRETSDALLAPGGQTPGIGLDHVHAALAQGGQIGLRGGMLVHVVVHRRRDDERAARSQRAAAKQVVGQAVGELGDRVRRGRGDQEEIGVAHELQVAERLVQGRLLIGERPPRRIVLVFIDEHRCAAQRGEGRLADEAQAGRRLHHAQRMARGGGQAHELKRLVRGDASADTQEDAGHGASICSGI